MSYLIGRLVHFNHPPSPIAILSLLTTVMLPQFSYALEFWRPSQQVLARLQSLLLRPLIRSAGLPRNADLLSIIAEFNIPRLRLYREWLILSFARRTIHLPKGHPSLVLLQRQLSLQSDFGVKTPISLFRQAFTCCCCS